MANAQRVRVQNWGHAVTADIEACGYLRPYPEESPMYHGTYVVTDAGKWAIVKKLYDAGFNVQVLHNLTSDAELILVNAGRFSQR